MSRLEVTVSSNWRSQDIPLTAPARRRSSDEPPADELLPRELLAPAGLEIVDARKLTLSARRSTMAASTLELAVPAEKDTHYVLAIRHESGALTFHAPSDADGRRRGAAKTETTVRFRVEVRDAPSDGGRRGLASRVIKTILLKVAGKVADKALSWFAKRWERRAWRKKGLSEGVFHVDRESLAGGALERARAAGLPTAAIPIRFDGAPWTLVKLRNHFRRRGTDALLANLTKDLKAAAVAGRLAGVAGDKAKAFQRP